jgi:hypothetical protein
MAARKIPTEARDLGLEERARRCEGMYGLVRNKVSRSSAGCRRPVVPEKMLAPTTAMNPTTMVATDQNRSLP